MALGHRGLIRMPGWYYAPTRYVEAAGGTYCPRHKNKCPANCPYRVPVKRRTPVPLSKLLIGRGQPGFIQNYGMFGTPEESDMGLGHHHRRGSGMRMFYGGYNQYPWWYSPMQYETTYEIITDKDGNKVKRVRRPVPITENPPEGEQYGVFGGSLSGILARQRTRGMGDDGQYGVLSRRCRPYGSLSRRYQGNTGVLGDDGDYGVLSRRRRPYGSLSRRYQGNTGVLGADPPPPSIIRTSKGAKWGLIAIAAGLGLLWFTDDSYTRPARLPAARRSTAIVPYEE